MRFSVLIPCFVILVATGATAAPASDSPLARLRLSAELFQMARIEQDPMLMIAAAKLRAGVVASQSERMPQGGGEAAQAGALQTDDMLAEAEELAYGDETLLGLIEDIRFERAKGVSDGPIFSSARIRAGGTDSYPGLPFDGGRYAEIYIEGKGRSDLNLYVLDSQDRIVCSDTDLSDFAYCGWNPSASASYRIEVRNRGDEATDYAMYSN